MTRTNADISIMLKTATHLPKADLESLEAWLTNHCPVSSDLQFNRDYLKAYRNDLERVARDGTPVWVAFCDDNEAMLFKLSWC